MAQPGLEFPHTHLLSAAQLQRNHLDCIFQRSDEYLKQLRLHGPDGFSRDLNGVVVVLAFIESSTRTRVSFEVAAKRLGAQTLNFQAGASSLSKGESLVDTMFTIEANHPDLIVVRHSAAGTPEFLAGRLRSGIINAGDGRRQHPTQGLLDAFALRNRIGSLEGVNICLIGDVYHSRVARSNFDILRTMGANVAACGPGTLMPDALEALGVRVFHNLDEALEWADVANVLRIQRERMDAGLLPSLREFQRHFGINGNHMQQHPELLVMHPGPVNRGVELSADVVEHKRSLVLDQVEAGVAIRMALLALISEARGLV